MPTMSETIIGLRNAIYARIKELRELPEIFAQEINDPDAFAFRPGFSYRAGGEQNDGMPWESLLFQNGRVRVILQYSLDRRRADFESQKITIHGHEFSCIKLFIYDQDPLPENAVSVRRDVENCLHKQLPARENCPYGIVCASKEEWGKRELGHVCDLRICDQKEMWNIPATSQAGTASKFIEAAAVAAADLLNPALFYCNNKADLFSNIKKFI